MEYERNQDTADCGNDKDQPNNNKCCETARTFRKNLSAGSTNIHRSVDNVTDEELHVYLSDYQRLKKDSVPCSSLGLCCCSVNGELLRGGLISLWLFKENNMPRD
jgi:hypothetical protein